jgi:hypothetical protein
MPAFVIDITVSVRIDADDFAMAERVADELELLYLEAAEPRKARFWTRIENETFIESE